MRLLWNAVLGAVGFDQDERETLLALRANPDARVVLDCLLPALYQDIDAGAPPVRGFVLEAGEAFRVEEVRASAANWKRRGDVPRIFDLTLIREDGWGGRLRFKPGSCWIHCDSHERVRDGRGAVENAEFTIRRFASAFLSACFRDRGPLPGYRLGFELAEGEFPDRSPEYRGEATAPLLQEDPFPGF
ncbi:hypothetical protein LAZ40_04690 [Cereibacter sphaeroides]|uniref:hypothetical protein n=1 Tax=Cereibacter sphaeroides TaxID=1063 RepID=UPI001F18ECE7|nr:hypothetical protein [Cereibacter sphaeroides]MCE6958353.1 hypothetical protein [Cereibacter sphaeroides]MCE6972220.1 hypothetical protein [Cereibacter sphaeroides]